jgi:hypothetical protein
LPDAGLLQGAREILDGLEQNSTADDALYLRRGPGGRSLLEHAAATHRKDGLAFWEPFLAFVLDRFGAKQPDALADQAILPTGRSELASAKSRVFFPPVRVARATDDEDRPQSVNEGGEELAAIDETVLSLLKFFDDATISVRTGTARDYAPLAQRLAPDTGRGLVRRPRQEDLINDALIPAMRESRGDNDRMLALLRQALLWLVVTPQKSKQRIATENLLVPVSGPGGAWRWAEARSAYLGEGWDTDPGIALLSKVYGDRLGKQLIAWDRFQKKAIQRFKDADRRWWLERMKEIGVAASPRLIRTPRLAVARSWSQHRLTPEAAVGCPVPCPASLWRGYMTHIARSAANTRSGQQFFLNEVCWIEGLEEDAIRAIVVEAMLRKPGRYDRHVRSKLARYGGEDSSDVLSLWVYALRAGDWATIPTPRGLCSPGRSWFLPLEARVAKEDRFAFLPCVRAEFSGARDLLKSFGVVAVEEAHIPRLAKALQELAGYVNGATFEESRQIDALASDLYEAIQGQLKAGESADGVRKLLDAPVPLLKGGRICQARLEDVAQLWIDDDPIRRRHIPGFTDCWVIPTRFQLTYPELVDTLRSMFGPERVMRVSESLIDVRFTPLEGGTILLNYLLKEFPDRPLAEHLGLLILKGCGYAASPHDEAFRLAWGRVELTRVVRGRFEGPGAVTACFDAQRAGGAALMVDSSLTAHEVVGETWQLIGPSYRAIWGAYTQALARETTERFFQEYGVSSAERIEVDSVIGGFAQRLRRFQPVCLALWRRAHPNRSCDDFHGEWSLHARTAESAAQWLAWEGLQGQVDLAARSDDPQASLSLLRSLDLTVSDWQKGRQELGQNPWRFASSERTYELARGALAGHVMAWFAYAVVPRASRSSGPTVPADLAEHVTAWAERIRKMAVPADLAEEDLPAAVIIRRASRDAVGCAGEDLSAHEAARVLLEPFRHLITSGLSEVSSIKLRDEPDKAATIYERDDAGTRTQQAITTVDDVVKVAAELATKHGEELKAGAIRDHPLVALLGQGMWANRVSVLATVRYALEGLAPATSGRMKDRQAFRDFDDWRDLWRKFEELGNVPAPAAMPGAKPIFTVAGTRWTQEEFTTSAVHGAAGAVAQRLAASVNPTIDLAAMRAVTRAKVQVPGATTGSGTGHGAGARKRPPDEYLAMLGAAGEYFVFEQLRVACRDFDVMNWLSKAREAFGYGPGDDSLGYDFAYDDAGGLLVGPAALSRRCLIEVKSSAQGGGDSFEMSMNEWEVARRCHQDSNFGTYAILRVSDLTSSPRLTDVLVDPVGLHLQGVLDYTSRDLLVAIGKVK